MTKKDSKPTGKHSKKTAEIVEGGRFKVEEIRRQLKAENPLLLSELDYLCKEKAGLQSIHGLLNENGHKISYSAVYHWHRSKFPKPFDHNEALAEKLESLHGAIGELLKKTATLKPEMLPALLREARAITEQLNNRQVIQDRRELELSVIYETFAEIELMTKDTAVEAIIQDVKRGVITKLEGR